MHRILLGLVEGPYLICLHAFVVIDHNKGYGLAVPEVGPLAFVGANNAALVDEYFLARFAHNKTIALGTVKPFHRAILARSTGLWGFAFIGGVWLGGTIGLAFTITV